MITIENLSKTRLFHDVPPEKLEIIRPKLIEQRFQQGQYIIRENTVGDLMFLLCKGTVIVTKELVKGIEGVSSREKVIATLKADYIPTLGENGLLGHGFRTANVIAQTDCVLYTLSNADYCEFAAANIEAAYQIMRNIARIYSERLHETDNNLVKLATAFYIAVQR